MSALSGVVVKDGIRDRILASSLISRPRPSHRPETPPRSATPPASFSSNDAGMTHQSPPPLPDARLKEWRKLQQSKYRKKTGLFVAEGIRCVEQILAGGKIRVEALVVGESAGFHFPMGSPGRVYSATPGQIAALSGTETPQPVIAICAIPGMPELSDLAATPTAPPARPDGGAPSTNVPAQPSDSAGSVLLLGLDALQDPGNMGAVIRTAAWFGIRGILSGAGTVDTWNPKTVRSAAGAIGAVPVLDVSLTSSMKQLKAWGWTLLGLDLTPESQSLRTIAASNPKPLLLILGNEANGISAEVRDQLDGTVFIEGVRDAVESLNASVSAAIALYELTRDA